MEKFRWDQNMVTPWDNNGFYELIHIELKWWAVFWAVLWLNIPREDNHAWRLPSASGCSAAVSQKIAFFGSFVPRLVLLKQQSPVWFSLINGSTLDKSHSDMWHDRHDLFCFTTSGFCIRKLFHWDVFFCRGSLRTIRCDQTYPKKDSQVFLLWQLCLLLMPPRCRTRPHKKDYA